MSPHTLHPSAIAGIGFTSQRTRDRMARRLRERGIADEALLATLASVPRHLFVDEAMATRAYEDVALPIGEGQTISQPWSVARMTELVLAGGGDETGAGAERPRRVLEVGTGSGYQAAVLSRLVEQVFTVERIRSLLDRARRRFRSLGYRNIQSRHSDGGWGWPGHSPFDAILVTAAPETVPEPLLDQLAVGGRLILPIGARRGAQSLTVITRTRSGFAARRDGDAHFVPFLSGKG